MLWLLRPNDESAGGASDVGGFFERRSMLLFRRPRRKKGNGETPFVHDDVLVECKVDGYGAPSLMKPDFTFTDLCPWPSVAGFPPRCRRGRALCPTIPCLFCCRRLARCYTFVPSPHSLTSLASEIQREFTPPQAIQADTTPEASSALRLIASKGFIAAGVAWVAGVAWLWFDSPAATGGGRSR